MEPGVTKRGKDSRATSKGAEKRTISAVIMRSSRDIPISPNNGPSPADYFRIGILSLRYEFTSDSRLAMLNFWTFCPEIPCWRRSATDANWSADIGPICVAGQSGPAK
jgi:hypothetical protein